MIHAGALGDSVLLWPLLRTLVRAGTSVTFAARPSHAALAARWIDPAMVTPVDVDRADLARLWTGEPVAPEPSRQTHDRLGVLSFFADEATDAGRRWLVAAAARWPGAELLAIGPQGSASRAALWQRFDVVKLGEVAPRPNVSGPLVFHVGAGSASKRWPLANFMALRDELAPNGTGITLIAGEVEAERFDVRERDAFFAAGGRILESLDDLAGVIAGARIVIANDSGPAHLAAQLGVPTLAIFGPTDPHLWAPVGPVAHVVAPAKPGPMTSVTLADVLAAARRMLGPGATNHP